MVHPALLATLFAAAPFGPAAWADDLDPDLLTCMGHFEYLASVWEEDLEQQTQNAPETVQLVHQLSANWEAFGHLLGTQDNCETPYAEVRDRATQATVDIFEEEQRRLTAGESYETVYADIWDRAVACSAAIGNDRLAEASRAVAADGPPCGWGQ
ncbi:hypothetical protein [Jannaschia sp. CCS1]|uniref:hypothetical protein n=1 Tax=Jannaschia sp. (strain CCS1) TaxID=290400 RepID=UPI000053C572|nr:hypothetical protein [Jannaschia sp. CCS1]ABD55383.1 hypothetical protein Jann_2466 [Jannaschia sp. CCS1]